MMRNGAVITPARTVAYEKVVAEAWNNAYGMLSLTGKLRVTINVHTDRHTVQDVDNLAKSILDGMQKAGVFTAGDQQVYSLGVIKHPSTKDEAGVWVAVTALDEYAD
jgi:Holliday junction resolvase RusA-like endonuclease